MLHHVIENGTIFSQEQILSTNLQEEIKKSQQNPRGFGLGFNMSTYLLDVVCSITPFPLIN